MICHLPAVLQMPRGVPVATVAIGGAANAALLAVRILAAADSPRGAALRGKMQVLVLGTGCRLV